MSAKNYKSELVGVFGYPVAENPTIVMQEAAFKALGLDYRYLTIEVNPEDLETAIAGMKAMNFKGINLTIPHKVTVLNYLDEVAEDAALMGAVNTVVNEGGLLIGENTDGKGFIKALVLDGGTDPEGKSFLVMGAGGAARAICVELALNGAQKITVVSRREEQGRALVNLVNDHTQTKAEWFSWTQAYVIPADTDVVVNATPIGLYPDVDPKANIDYDSITHKMIVCDVIPNPPQTAFLKEAQKRGAKTLDGLSMLVYQGAIGFRLWTGQEAPIEVMKAALEAAFDEKP